MRRKQRWLWIFAFAAIAVIFLAIGLISFTHNSVDIRIDNDATLTDEMALKVSQKALEQLGLDHRLLRPETYNGKDFFARNTLNEKGGYVLWMWSDEREIGYSVRLSQNGNVVHCTVNSIL